MVSRLARLEQRYSAHQGRRHEFVFGAGERAGILAVLVGGPGLRVLDLGCRTGALTASYAKGNTVVGVDVDRDALAVARDRLEIDTIWCDVEDGLPFPDGSYDVVVAGELLEHLTDPAALVGEAARVLRPGGRLVGSVPNAFRLKSRLRYLAGRHPETDRTHLQLFTPAALAVLLAGFNDVHVTFAVGRYRRCWPRLMGRVMVFSATRRAPLPGPVGDPGGGVGLAAEDERVAGVG